MTISSTSNPADAATKRIFNFSAGPATLPTCVLEQIRDELLSFQGIGASILEISHRSDDYKAVHAEAQANIRKLLNIPDNYRVLFLQGGSRLQFAMIPMNLANGGNAQYLVTGAWSKKAADEANALPNVTTKVLWDGSETNFDRLPTSVTPDGDASFLYYCSNETIHGVQFPTAPSCGDTPLISDASSDFMCRPIDIEKHGLVYACAQKNAGPAGVTIAIVRDDMLGRCDDGLPGYLNYKLHDANDSMFNTPPTFAIYVVNLIAKWLIDDIGGLDNMQSINESKAKTLYDVIDASDGFFAGHAQPESRSLMNVTFQLPNDDLQAQFIAGAAERDLGNLKGHRSVGGIRASIYNAMPQEGVSRLAEYMTEFAQKNR